jgi:surface protein
MKKIVRGNDFTLRIPVRKIVNGEQVAFPLPACTDIVVNIVNQYRRVALSYTIDTTDDNIINARVEGDAVSVGTYALEVRGKIFGNDWRSNEYEQFAIVDNNASGDTAFNGELIEGEDSVEMNTALVILPPTAELTQLITDANTALETAKQTDATLKANESERTEAEQQRASAEVARVSAENKRSESEEVRQAAEVERVSNEDARKTAEAQRANAESERVEAEKTRTTNETARVAAEKQRTTTFTELSANVDTAVSEANTAASAANTATEKANAAEAQRAEAENQRAEAEAARKQNENMRQGAETERVRQETARETAEATRQNAEAEREKADAEREKRVSEAISSTSSAAKVATDAAAVATEAGNNADSKAAEAERVNAELNGNVLTVTDRTGEVKTLELMDQAEASETKADVTRIKESMGAYSDRPNITLTAKQNNVAISADGVMVSKNGWAIAEFTAELGNIYLFNPGETSSDVCVFAEYIDKLETRAIDYAYMYDGSGRVLTAKATYNGKTYIYTYDYSSSITTITDQDGNNVTSLPSVYTTTVGAYQPMTILNANAELPEDGYCRFVSNFTTASAIKIVVSYKIDSANLAMKVVRDGSTANMCSQLAKINKKVDEVSAKIPKMWVEIRSKKSIVIVIDEKDILLEPYKSYTFKDIKSFSFKATLPDGSPSPNPQCIYLCDFHFNETVPMIALPKAVFGKWAESPDPVWANIGMTTLNLKGFTFDNVNSLRAFCWIMTKLKHLNIENVNSNKVTDMSQFLANTAITEIDLSGLDTRNVTDMSQFLANTAITEIDLSGLDTRNVTDMSQILYLTPLKKINLSGVNTQSVTTMNGFLKYCPIQSLTVGEDFGRMKDSVGTLDFSEFVGWRDNSVKSLLTLYDRKANGLGVITIKLHANTKAVLGEDGIAQLTAKGYIIA